jgi:hypothetical protein
MAQEYPASTAAVTTTVTTTTTAVAAAIIITATATVTTSIKYVKSAIRNSQKRLRQKYLPNVLCRNTGNLRFIVQCVRSGSSIRVAVLQPTQKFWKILKQTF